MTLTYRPTLCAALFALSLSALPAMADDAALYSEAVPTDAVFVRYLDSGAPKANTFQLAGNDINLADFSDDTYVAISATDLSATGEPIEAGSYYSVMATVGGTALISEPARETSAKVHLILVNTAPEAARLIVADAGAEVVGATEEGAAASRAVNPVAATLAVERVSDGEILGRFDVKLARGQNLTFVAGPDGARVIENAFGPVLRVN